jgi:hypothetical protein
VLLAGAEIDALIVEGLAKTTPKRNLSLALRDENSNLRRLFLLAAKAVVVLYVVLDAIVAPVFRPLLRWITKLRFFIRLQDIVHRAFRTSAMQTWQEVVAAA